MLDERSLKNWLLTLGDTAKAAVDAGLREDWPSDSEKNIQILINELSITIEDLLQRNELEKLKSLDNSTLLGLSALFTFPRTLRLLNIIGNVDPEKISHIANKSLAIDQQSKEFLELLYLRIAYTARTYLMLKIFSKERRTAVYNSILAKSPSAEQETPLTNEANKAAEPTSGLPEVESNSAFEPTPEQHIENNEHKQSNYDDDGFDMEQFDNGDLDDEK
jgi:hypothetical protein